MTAPPELLGLRHDAVERTESLTGVLRHWQHLERGQLAIHQAQLIGTVRAVGGIGRVSGGADDQEMETRWRVTVGSGGRYRQEIMPSHGPIDGPPSWQAWAYLEANNGQAITSLTDDKVYRRLPQPSVVQRLLDPSWVLTHDLQVTGQSTSSGRAVINVHAVARPNLARSGTAQDMAAERDLVVDAERGFLHVDTALLDGVHYESWNSAK